MAKNGTIGNIVSSGNTYLVASTAYGTCTTEASTAAKVATIQDSAAFTLLPGITIHIKFTYSNAASNPTLNVNGTGAKNIYRYGTIVPGTSASASWQDGAIVSLTYDGNYWIINDFRNDVNTTYSAASDGGLVLSNTNAFSIANSVTAGTVGTSSATSGNSLAVPYVTYDSHGNITATGTHTHTITNNVTGSGTTGYLTKFNGSNTITNGPALGNSTTTFLRNDGTWAAPAIKGTSYTTCVLPTFNAAGSANVAITGITAAHNAILDIYIDTAAHAAAYNEAWSHIYRANTYDGGITFYSDAAITGGQTVMITYY